MNDHAHSRWLQWQSIREWNDLPAISGVYEISNRSSGLCYIGSAISLRARGHFKHLESGKSHNVRLQRDYANLGADAFYFRVIIFCPNQDPVPVEQQELDRRDFATLYNTAPIAGSTLGYRFTDEQVEKVSMRRKGVPMPYETKKRNWQRNVQRAWKQKAYRKLLRAARKTAEYQLLLHEIEEYMKREADWGRPVIVEAIPSGRKVALGKRFGTWWLHGGGREHMDAKYHFVEYAWRNVNGTEAELKAHAFDSWVGTMAKTRDLIAERVLNERLAPEINAAYDAALKTGSIDLEYKPMQAIDSPFANMFRTQQVTTFEDGSVKSLGQSVGNVALHQEWHQSGLPKLGLLEDHVAQTIQKRLWHQNGKPQALICFTAGSLHGPVCKWNEEGEMIFAARYENGTRAAELSSDEIEALPPMTETITRPSGPMRQGLSVGICLDPSDLDSQLAVGENGDPEAGPPFSEDSR